MSAYLNGKKIGEVHAHTTTGSGGGSNIDTYTKEEIDLKLRAVPNEAITSQELETILK